jgi:hypothetical protein
MMEGPWCRFRREARARERHRHRPVDSLKALDPKRPIREADMCGAARDVRLGQKRTHAPPQIGGTQAVAEERRLTCVKQQTTLSHLFR